MEPTSCQVTTLPALQGQKTGVRIGNMKGLFRKSFLLLRFKEVQGNVRYFLSAERTKDCNRRCFVWCKIYLTGDVFFQQALGEEETRIKCGRSSRI